MSILSYTVYNDRSLSVKGDRNKFSDDVKKLGGKWNPRTRDGGSWILPIEKENDIKNLIYKNTQNGNSTQPWNKQTSRKHIIYCAGKQVPGSG